jgi:hypothetical protein
LEASVWVFCLGFPWEPKAERGKTVVLKSEAAFWVRYQDSPVQWCTVASPEPSPQGEIPTVLDGCWVKALSCTAGGSGSLAVELHGISPSQHTLERAPE